MELSVLQDLWTVSVPHHTVPQPGVAAAWTRALSTLPCSYISLQSHLCHVCQMAHEGDSHGVRWHSCETGHYHERVSSFQDVTVQGAELSFLLKLSLRCSEYCRTVCFI